MRGLGGRAVRRSAVALVLALALASTVSEATTLYGLPAGGLFIVRFESTAPRTITDAAVITGLEAGERLVGIDFRPRTGQLFGLGITPGSPAAARLYVVDPHFGVATLVGAARPASPPPASRSGSTSIRPSTGSGS
jgi:hypothetical protein